jgi:hypothetical protein
LSDERYRFGGYRNRNNLKLLTVDILALATMKNAAKCDT